MSHNIIFDDTDVIPVNNHNQQDYDVDLTFKTSQIQRKKKLKSQIIEELTSTNWKSINIENRPEVVRNLIQYYTGYSIDSVENNQMTEEIIQTYHWYFK
jgi:hypothetical protein